MALFKKGDARKTSDYIESKTVSGLRKFAQQRRRQLQFASNVSRPLYGRAGRPKGSYKGMYSAYGGVYGYRKAIAQQRRLQAMQAMRDSQLTPEQQILLAQAAARQRAARENLENRTIPDTTGYSNIGTYHKEIDDASNIVP